MITAHQSSSVAAARIHLLDPREIVYILDHSSEKSLFLRALQERIPNTERRNFILDIIDRVRNFDKQQQQQSASSSSSSSIGRKILLPENLHRNFVTVALPEILQNLPPANIMRQGIENFSVIIIDAATTDGGGGGDTAAKNNEEENASVTAAADDNNHTNKRQQVQQHGKNNNSMMKNVENPCADDVNNSNTGSCVASRISITGKAGATNAELIKFHNLTHFVKCCELLPQHQGKVVITLDTNNNNNKSDSSSSSTSSLPVLFDAGIKDDDSATLNENGVATLSSKFDAVVDFVKKVLRENKTNKILIYCQAGKHRSAWYSAAVLASLASDPEFCCPCLAHRTRYYSSLSFSIFQIVKQSRNFVDFSPNAEEQITKWIDQATKTNKQKQCEAEE